MWPIALHVVFLLCVLDFSIEARGYFGRRPRPQTDLPPEETPISSKRFIPDKPIREHPVRIRPQPSRCPRRRCNFDHIPDSCRQETFFFSASGRQCSGCDMDICEERHLNTVITSSTDQVTSERDPIRDSIGGRRQAGRTQSARTRNSISRDHNLRAQNDFRNNELFDAGLQNRRNSQSLTERDLSSRLPLGLDLLMSQISGQDLPGSNSGNNQDFGTSRGPRRQFSRQSPWLQSSQNQAPVSNSASALAILQELL